MENQDHQWELFWSRLLYPVLFEDPDSQKVTHHLESLSTQEIIFPNGKRKKPSLSTLWRKLKAYREGGFESLSRKPRKDRGSIRSVDQEIMEKAIEIKRDLPSRSSTIINVFLDQQYSKTIPQSTLYRHLRQAGATQMKLGTTKKEVRCRWTRDHTHSVWCGDFADGPCVLMDGQAHKTYLSAFIDVHSRFVVDARYYLRQNMPILIDTLLRAFAVHGIPRALYTDNAKIYYGEQLEAACFSMNIKSLHRPPRTPEPGGIIEKFIQTTQSQFETEVRASGILSLDELNRALSAWLNVVYHQTIHRETNETPAQRYQSGLIEIRKVHLDSAIKFFMKKVERKVHIDFSDISIEGRLYKVDPKWRGDKIIAKWDPFSDLKTVLVYSLRDEYLGTGRLHQREKESFSPSASVAPKPRYDFLQTVVNAHEEQLQKQARGIDYTYAANPRNWSFLSFITTMARLMGRKGGTSAFNAQEHEALKKVYDRYPQLTENVVVEASENTTYNDIVNITYQLQLIMK